MDEFPSGRRCATTQHRFGHRGRDAHTSVSRGAGGVARAYMHIHGCKVPHPPVPGQDLHTYATPQPPPRCTAVRSGRGRRRREGRTKGKERGMGYAENGGGEERSTWKLCGGVKLQRPARCLPFAGDIRNSSVVTAPNRGVDPLDRCIHRGRGALLCPTFRSPRHGL